MQLVALASSSSSTKLDGKDEGGIDMEQRSTHCIERFKPENRIIARVCDIVMKVSTVGLICVDECGEAFKLCYSREGDRMRPKNKPSAECSRNVHITNTIVRIVFLWAISADNVYRRVASSAS